MEGGGLVLAHPGPDHETLRGREVGQALQGEAGLLKRKLLSLSHCQELGQLTDLASDWFFTLVQPIRS